MVKRTKDSWPGSQGLPWLLAVSLSLNMSLNPQSGNPGKWGFLYRAGMVISWDNTLESFGPARWQQRVLWWSLKEASPQFLWLHSKGLVQAPVVFPVLLCQKLYKYHQDGDSVSTLEKCRIGADICKLLSGFDGLELFLHLPTSWLICQILKSSLLLKESDCIKG